MSRKKKIPTTIFEWRYGEIRELTEEEKNEINQIRHKGRKQYQKPCSLCGVEGHIELRKVSEGNGSLICKSCAEQYVLSATRLMEKGIE